MPSLADAVDELDAAALGSSPGRLADACLALGRLQAVLAEAIGSFDAQGLWALDHATSMTAWLKTEVGMAATTAASLAQVARRLRDMPGTQAALRDGTLSFDQARAITARLEPETAALWREHEPTLLPVLAGLSVADVARAMDEWRQRARAATGDETDPAEARGMHLSELPEGWRLDGVLDAEGGSLVSRAMAAATSPDGEGEPVRTAAQKRCDALVDVCRWFLDHRAERGAGKRTRPHLDVVCAADDLTEQRPARTSSGQVVDAATLQRLACDAAVARVLVRGGSRLLDYGHATRIVPAALFLALVLGDRHCRWPGCDRTADWCEAHHLLHWVQHGPTEIDNLALMCSRHHHLLHQPGWTAKLDPYDATIWITSPDGRMLSSRPPPVAAPTSLFAHAAPDG